MAEWAYILDNKIEELHDQLPNNWKNISGLNLGKDDLPLLKSLGWFPVSKNYQWYNDLVYKIDGYEYTIQEHDILESYKLVDLPQPVVVPFDAVAEKVDFLVRLRLERNKRLSESDWTQLSDIQSKLEETEKVRWSTYRQALRDLPDIYSNDETFTLENITWPGF